MQEIRVTALTSDRQSTDPGCLKRPYECEHRRGKTLSSEALLTCVQRNHVTSGQLRQLTPSTRARLGLGSRVTTCDQLSFLGSICRHTYVVSVRKANALSFVTGRKQSRISSVWSTENVTTCTSLYVFQKPNGNKEVKWRDCY